MASPTSVNSKITDAVSQSLLFTIGQAPSLAVATALSMAANANAMSALQAVHNQQSQATLLNAIAASGAALIIGGVDVDAIMIEGEA